MPVTVSTQFVLAKNIHQTADAPDYCPTEALRYLRYYTQDEEVNSLLAELSTRRVHLTYIERLPVFRWKIRRCRVEEGFLFLLRQHDHRRSMGQQRLLTLGAEAFA